MSDSVAPITASSITSTWPVRSVHQNAFGFLCNSHAPAPISAASALIAIVTYGDLGVCAAHRYSPRYQISGGASVARSAAVTAPMPIVWSPPGTSSLERAADPGERSFDDGNAVVHGVLHAGELLGLGRLGGEQAGEILLARRQHVDAEALGLADDLAACGRRCRSRRARAAGRG